MAIFSIPASLEKRDTFPKFHISGLSATACASGLSGTPQPVSPSRPCVSRPQVSEPIYKRAKLFPNSGFNKTKGSVSQIVQSRRRIQTVCGIWFLIVTSLVFSVYLSSCTPLSDNAKVPLSLHFRLDPSLFSAVDISPSGDAKDTLSGSKTIAPGESWTTSRYSISATGPAGAVFSKETKLESLTATLSPGSWDITVRALNSSAKTVALARGTVLLEAGRSANLNLEMLPAEGNGSLTIHLSSSLTPPAGSRITGNLTPVDGPAQHAGMPSLTTIFNIDIESVAPAIEIADVPAGFYVLNLALSDSRGSIAGASETVLILSGFQTSGDCRLVLGAPGFSLTLNPVTMLPITDLVLTARHKATMRLPFCPALAGGVPGTGLIYTLNGGRVGISTVGSAPPGTPVGMPLFTSAGNIDASSLPGIVRLDVVARDPASGLQGSTGEIYEFESGPQNGTLAWKALYDAKATTGSSIFPGSPGSLPGTDTPAPVKAVAATKKPGIILAAGLDDSSSVHAFRITEHDQLFRLWKDKVTISTSKTPDRLAISLSGTTAAAAGSSSSWLRVYRLDDAGRKIALFDFTSSSPGLTGLSYVKALAFSADSKRLYVLANSPESIYVFLIPEIPGSTPVLEHHFDIDSLYPGTSLSMSSLAVASDGSIAASSSGTSRVFIFIQETSSLRLLQTIDKTMVGIDFTKPEALTFSNNMKDLYILCDRSAIRHLHREEIADPFLPTGNTLLPASFEDSTSLLFGTRESDDSAFLVASGGVGPVFIPVNVLSGIPGVASILEPAGEDNYGLTGTSGAVISGDTLVLAGSNTSCSVSLVGIVTP